MWQPFSAFSFFEDHAGFWCTFVHALGTVTLSQTAFAILPKQLRHQKLAMEKPGKGFLQLHHGCKTRSNDLVCCTIMTIKFIFFSNNSVWCFIQVCCKETLLFQCGKSTDSQATFCDAFRLKVIEICAHTFVSPSFLLLKKKIFTVGTMSLNVKYSGVSTYKPWLSVCWSRLSNAHL